MYNNDIQQAKDITSIIHNADVIYMTRLQSERLPKQERQKKYSDEFRLTINLVQKAKSSLMILHPLPRVGEIEEAIDKLPQAFYFQQAKNGLAVRKAILTYLLC